MGPPESPTGHFENQERRPKRSPRRPRARLCLLKGCEERFHPRQARQRYCSEGCREAGRKWSRRKAQERYRETAAGQQKRNGQSLRYRERVKSRKPPEPEAVNDPARVITTEHSFRSLLRPARLLRELRTCHEDRVNHRNQNRGRRNLPSPHYQGRKACKQIVRSDWMKYRGGSETHLIKPPRRGFMGST